MTQPKSFRYIILDTNIFQHFGNDELAKQILEILKDAVSKNYILSLSQYSILELVDNASTEKEAKRLTAMGGIKNFKVKQRVLITAGHLGSLYMSDGMEPKQQPERGDKIIGATAILYDALIYTTNAQDFPPPYFKEISRHLLFYKKSGRDVCVMGYFMEPDLDAVISRYNHRINNKIQKQLVPRNENTE